MIAWVLFSHILAPQLGRGVLTLPSLTLGGPSLCLNSGPDSEPGVNGGLGSLLFSPCFLSLPFSTCSLRWFFEGSCATL